MELQGIDKVISNLQKNINNLEVTYNRKDIGRRASFVYKSISLTWGEAQQQAWYEYKKVIIANREKVEILKAQLNRFYTPGQFHTTEVFKLEQMNNAVNNLNK